MCDLTDQEIEPRPPAAMSSNYYVNRWKVFDKILGKMQVGGQAKHISVEGQAKHISVEGQAKHISVEGQAKHISVEEPAKHISVEESTKYFDTSKITSNNAFVRSIAISSANSQTIRTELTNISNPNSSSSIFVGLVYVQAIFVKFRVSSNLDPLFSRSNPRISVSSPLSRSKLSESRSQP